MRKKCIAVVCKTILFTLFFTGSLAQQAVTVKKKNYFLLCKPAEIDNYIKIYQNEFSGENEKRHTKSIYLDTTYFKFIADYFAANPDPDYDGVRIFFVSYNEFVDTVYTHQADKKQITLLMVPTKRRLEQFDEFKAFANKANYIDALNHGELCPNSCNSDPDEGSVRSAKAIGEPRGPNPIIFLTPAKAKKYIDNYRENYCMLWNKKHTKSLWLSRENFKFLKGFFDSENRSQVKYSGIRIHFAVYNRKVKAVKNQRKKQITLIFTAAKSGTHESACEALSKFGEAHHDEYFNEHTVYGELSTRRHTRKRQ